MINSPKSLSNEKNCKLKIRKIRDFSISTKAEVNVMLNDLVLPVKD